MLNWLGLHVHNVIFYNQKRIFPDTKVMRCVLNQEKCTIYAIWMCSKNVNRKTIYFIQNKYLFYLTRTSLDYLNISLNQWNIEITEKNIYFT